MGAAAVEFLPREYGYVALVLVAYCFLNFWMAFQVGKARKRYFSFRFFIFLFFLFFGYKVFYPTLYASESENKDAKIFNCVQRGHQNSLEMMPMFFVLMVLGGLRHPCATSALGILYVVSRFFYFKGYSTGDPQKRLTLGKYGFLAIFGLMGCAISFGVSLLRGG
ncbi:hypothetical protein FEM48_Zijuj04G0111400 [Ziziphus jujuba var. spinosa]|uniref:Glutathione S-transferase 3, mitochondrial n=1 Tax=Ziziphus jujuba var. spinosa TaxID=714518 RepID=A0A978VJI8_ZIZJJ|nr:hypothetical protein FEM48_Zijuj04G0111400 [Ziziphus jujuba var. spinosa]